MQVLLFLTETAKREYGNQTARFQGLVRRDHPLLAVYTAMLKWEPLEVRDSWPGLFTLHSFLLGFFQAQCPICYGVFMTLKSHMKQCAENKFNHRAFLTVSIDQNFYACVFGCPIRERNNHEIYQHYRDSHNAEELKSWAINKEVLFLRDQ